MSQLGANHLLLDSGPVSTALTLPPDDSPARFVYVLAHGAGAPFDHQHMAALAECFCEVGIATLRFNFPYMQAGRRRVDSKAVAVESIARAVDLASTLDLPVVLGGHSFGGRMASHAVAESAAAAEALIYCSFPLHPAKKPGVERAAHLSEISVPQLFISGTRDALADGELLEATLARLNTPSKTAEVAWLEGADHSFKTRKRDGVGNPYDAAAAAAAKFLASVPGLPQ